MPLADLMTAEPEALVVAVLATGVGLAWAVGRAVVTSRRLSFPLFVAATAPSWAGLLLTAGQMALHVGGVDAEGVVAFGARLGAWDQFGTWVNALVCLGAVGLVVWVIHCIRRVRARAEDGS